MPIASGANNWPKTYWSRPPKKAGVHSRVIVVNRPDPPELRGPSAPGSPQVTYRSPSPPPPGHPLRDRTPSPPPSRSPPRRNTIEEIVHERIRYDDPPPQTPPTQVTRYYDEPAPHPRGSRTRLTRYGRDRRYGDPNGPGYDRYQYGYRSNGPRDSRCCGNHLFNSGKAGGDTGCCQGGLFSNKRYPYGAEDFYKMPGDGRHRCCACIWGIIAGLLLLGLLIGLLAGLMPALQKQNAQSAIASKYPNGQLYNGIYYYQVTNPPDVFYFALGRGLPCNSFNNNSATQAARTVTATATATATVPATTTRTTLPDCNSITTSFVQVAGVSIPTTTLSWAQQFPNKASKTTNGCCTALSLMIQVMCLLLAHHHHMSHH